jgi:hypothetical protein
MKKVIEITSFIILTIVLFTSGVPFKQIRTGLTGNSLMSPKGDTTNLISLIKVDSFGLSIFPPASGVQFYKNGIVFLSLSKLEKKMSPNQISFGTIEAYYAPVIDTVLGKHSIFSHSSPFSYPCDGMTFSKDFSTIYFTKIPKKDTKEKIFMAKVVSVESTQTDLTEGTPLDFCSDNYTYSHPTLSSDGNMMIFASDRMGSEGGMDLFLSRKTGDKWSAPENLGKDINTAGNEFFPFLDSENNLFFSSDRLPGHGGYDIFTCKFNGSGWGKPVNLPDRINSDKDDIAFTINNTDGKTAFFTRRSKEGKGEMQLFRVIIKKEFPEQEALTLSEIFTGKQVLKPSYIAAADSIIKPPETETSKTKTRTETVTIKPKTRTETATSKPKTRAETVTTKPKPGTETTKKEEPKVPVSNVSQNKAPVKMPVTGTETQGKPTDAKVVTIKLTAPLPADQKDVVIYRIQILSANKPKSEKEIVLNGKTYVLFEYFYLGSYRYTVGEFRTIPPATELQKLCRQSAYPQAFVVAFKNDTRSTDLKLFK